MNKTSMNSQQRFEKLNHKVSSLWKEILDQSPLVRTVMNSPKVDRRLYALYLLETYHYTSHNAKNQALVGVRYQGDNIPYMKFCFEHANEEAGHELMALHDLKALGMKTWPIDLPQPLPATDVLNAYLYYISFQGNPLARLGYSFWAESVYTHINPLLVKIQKDLNLTKSQMTFFMAHSEIDAKHADEVASVISSSVRSEKDWDDIERVMTTSLKLTSAMLTDINDAFLDLVKNEETSPYRILNELKDLPTTSQSMLSPSL
jgi:pyrroloquinoline quinone (PQQ) biosynthesis protein C